MNPNVSVILPCYNGAHFLNTLISVLLNQSISPIEIIVVDSESTDGTEEIARDLGCTVFSIPQSEFNHGGTRNFASLRAKGDILVFLTQDALPKNSLFLQHLLAPICSSKSAASFARQVPYPEASVGEKFARAFNYPPVSEIRTITSIQTMGLRAYFFSNVSSAIRKDVFMDVGMFADDVIMNEDMLMCAKLLNAGHSVAYVAEAEVFHSHDYSLLQTFQRYFDIGVFFSRHFNIPDLATNERGATYTRELLAHMVKNVEMFAFFHAIGETCAKFGGFFLGKLEKFIPMVLKKHLSMHAGFWQSSTFQSKAKHL